jgi:hypothetical protein
MSVPGGLYSTLISGATPFSGSYLQYASSGVQQASYTFDAQNIGVADTSRMIVVAVSAASPRREAGKAEHNVGRNIAIHSEKLAHG